VLARPKSNRRNLAALDVEIAEGSLENPASLAAAVGGCRYLFHVAADYRLWVPDRAAMFAANVEGTRNLILAAHAAGLERIVYTSSVAVLGLAKGTVSNEETSSRAEDMIGPYKLSKFEAEAVVRQLVAERDIPVVIVNPSTPIGPGDVKPTPTGRVIVEAGRGRMPGYVDTGLNVVHVHDCAGGHLLAAEKGRVGERYILGGDNLSLAEILGVVAAATGRKAPRIKIPYGVILPIAAGAEAVARVTKREPFVSLDSVRMSRKQMYFSSDKAVRELGYAPRPASEAITDAVSWFKANGYFK
jgi:dihydroflavonol-4-reductase